MRKFWPSKRKAPLSRLRILVPKPRAAIAVFVLAAFSCGIMRGQQSLPPAGQSATPRHIGVIKSINGTAIVLSPDSGPDVSVTIQPTTRLLRIAPGEKDLKNATPIQSQDLQVGDRILVGGKAPDDTSPVMATTIVVMTHSDIQARHQHELEDWQKRGVDGPVTAIDATAGRVTI